MSELLKMIEELKNHPLIEIKDLGIGKPVTHNQLGLIENGFDLTIPQSLKNLLGEHNGINLFWVADEKYPWKRIDEHDNFTPFGRLWLPDLETMFLGPDTSNWETYIWEEETEEVELDALQQLVPLDYFDNDRSECICMKKTTGALLTDPLYYFSIESGRLPFDSSLEKYIEHSAKLKAFSYWQQALMIPGGQTRKYLDHYFPQLFPGIELNLPAM